MSWVRSEDNEPNHPKIFRAGIAAYGFFHAAKCYCSRNLTNGFVPVGDLSLISPSVPFGQATKFAVKLTECGLFEKQEEPPGWQIHDYLDYNPSRVEVLERRDERAASGRLGGLAKAKADAKHQLGRSYPTGSAPTRPDPSPPETEEPEALSGARPTANGFQHEAREILEWLNSKTGKHFEFIATNLEPIKARLREGREAWQLKKVVSVKAKSWATDEKMREFLRPATLFNKTKCAQYIGELPAPGVAE